MCFETLKNAPKVEFMNLSFNKKFGLALFLLVLATTFARAQAAAFEIKIPFDFMVKGQTMPPGVYRVGRLSPENPRILIMKKTEGSEKVVFLTQSAMAAKNSGGRSTVMFRRFADRYFLYRIYPASEKYGNELLPGKLELKLRRQASAAAELVSLSEK
jgi:hypothetical protein